MIYYSTFWNFYLWWEMLFWKRPLHGLFDNDSDFRTAQFSLVIFKRKSLHQHCTTSMLNNSLYCIEKHIWTHNIKHEDLRIFSFFKFLIFIIIFYYFQVYNILVRQLCDLQVIPLFYHLPGTVQGYYNVADYIPYAVFHVPVILLQHQSVLLNPLILLT